MNATATPEVEVDTANFLTPGDVVRAAAEAKSLKPKETLGTSFFRTVSMALFTLDKEMIEALEKATGFCFEERPDGTSFISREDRAEDSWFFEEAPGILGLYIHFEIDEKRGGVVCRVFVDSSLVSCLDPDLNHKLAYFLISLDSDKHPFVVKIVEQSEGLGITLLWKEIGLEGLRSISNLFERDICANEKNTMGRLVRSPLSPLNPSPYLKRENEIFVPLSEQEALVALWREQIEKYREDLIVRAGVRA